MADIDSRFKATSDVDTYYVDKDTGFPLAGGQITFYSDVDRTVKKRIYQLTGSPGAYTFEPLPNPSTLSGVGTFQDELGNNIVPYYFPYEGLPEATNNQVELYYIEVISAEGVPQLTRQAWPPNIGGESSSSGEKVPNFIPNGQFLINNEIVSDTQPPFETFGSFKAQPIAQGGWFFLRSTGGSSTFENSFSEVIGEISGINDFPRNVFNFKCTSFNSSDSVRDVAISWPDVNKFSGGDPAGTAPYTYVIEAQSNDTNTYVFDVRLIRYFGTGGVPSPTSDTSIGSFTVTPTYSYFNLFIDGIAGDTGQRGTDNNDRIFITLRGPSGTWDIQTTGWVFAGGNLDLTYFPTMTNAEMAAQSLNGFVDLPNPNGAQLGLTQSLTLKGMIWDDSEIGEIKTFLTAKNFTGSIHNTSNLLLMDGNSYVTEEHSPLGIPYFRLQQYLWDNTNNWPIFGTGVDFATSYVSPTDNSAILLNTNQPLAQANAVDGSISTGFSFSNLQSGDNSINMFAYVTDTVGQVLIMSTTPMTLASADYASAGTSGFSVQQIYPQPINALAPPYNTDFLNVYQLVNLEISSLPAAGTYFTFTNTSGNPFYVWFTINGGGSDPAPGGTGILVKLNSGFNIAQAASLIRDAISGFCSSYINMASFSYTPSSFFEFQANNLNYFVTYIVDGVGTATIGGIPIYVQVSSSDNTDQIALATQIAINSYKFATPNASGCFFRSMNQNAGNIIGNPPQSLANRFSLTDYPSSNLQGTYEFSDNIAHSHELVLFLDGVNGVGPTESVGAPQLSNAGQPSWPTQSSGNVESRPFNMGVFYAIKY